MAQTTVTVYFDRAGYPEDEIEITATVEATPVKCDYGVEGSPVWTEYEDAKIQYPIEIDGRDWLKHQLSRSFSQDGIDRIEAAIIEAAYEKDEWE